MKSKKLPMRTCIGCREVKPKKGLIRIVRAVTGEVATDSTGKASGRGAYICPREECLETAFKKKRFSHALDYTVTEVDLERLKEELRALIRGKEVKATKATQ